MNTLREAIKVIKCVRIGIGDSKRLNIADELLGKYKNILPKGKTSTQFIKEMRNTFYGKVK